MKIFWVFCCLAPLTAQDFLDRKIPLGNHKANQLYMEENYQEALKSYLDLYGQDTENGALAYNLGNTYAALGDMQKAEEYYQRAARLKNPEAEVRSQFNLGNLQMQGQQFGDAVQSYADYLRNRPEDTDAKRNLELALRQLEQQQQQKQQKDQDQEQDQEQNEEESESSSSESQDQQDQEQEESPSQSEQEQNQENQQQQKPQDQEQQEEQSPEPKNQPEQQPQDQSMDEDMKEQILEALKEQELEQQKEHQKRKIGRVKRRAKDW